MSRLTRIWLTLTQLGHARNRGQKARMSRMTKLAQEDSTFSEFATTPRFRGFHSVNRGQLLASSAMDLGDQTGLNRGHPCKQKIHPTPLTFMTLTRPKLLSKSRS